VRINVIRVLATTDSEMAPRNNIGCRLTEDEIGNYMLWLFAYSHRFSDRPLVFEYLPTPSVYRSQNITGRPYSIANWLALDVNNNVDPLLNDPNYDPTRINIYFVGDIFQPLDPSGTHILGFTFDPLARTLSNDTVRSHIFISDRDFDGSGVIVNCDDLVLEHEFCHFLLRKNNIGGYNVDEHDPTENPSVPHLMTINPTGATVLDDDFQKTRIRIVNGTYLLP